MDINLVLDIIASLYIDEQCMNNSDKYFKFWTHNNTHLFFVVMFNELVFEQLPYITVSVLILTHNNTHLFFVVMFNELVFEQLPYIIVSVLILKGLSSCAFKCRKLK
jgi:hypothetical protein